MRRNQEINIFLCRSVVVPECYVVMLFLLEKE